MIKEAKPCRYCGGVRRIQVVSPVSDHAWADCFCIKEAPEIIAVLPQAGEVEKCCGEYIAGRRCGVCPDRATPPSVIPAAAVERVARAIDPKDWAAIDQWRPSRGTANFDSRIDDMRDASIARASAALSALPTPSEGLTERYREERKAQILKVRFPYIAQQEANRPVTVHWFDVIRAIEMALATPEKDA